MKIKTNFNKAVLPHIIAVLGFFLISVVYFSPMLNQKKLETHDWKVYQAAVKEYKDYKNETGQNILWTNSMFSGMPTYLIHSPKDNNVFTKIGTIINFGNWRPIAHLFYYLLGFYILLLVFRVNPWLSMSGAAAFGFSSYFFIIIAAGHVTKAVAIGYMAPVIAGIYLAYDRKAFWGMILMSFFLILQILTNHLQIVYYTLFTSFILGLFLLVNAIRQKKLMSFVKTTFILIGGMIISVGVSATPLLTTYEYGKYSIRGASELTTNKDNQTSGLDKDYITQWSYGVDETLTLLVPNYKGGSSMGELSRDSETFSVLKRYIGPENAASIIKQMPLYFGTQPMTSGPVYVGAFVFFLFVLGLFLVKGKYKWWLLTATILSILLSWGKNFMPFTDIFLDYFPGYNKFRTVSMTLVIAEFTIPLLGFLALREIILNKTDIKTMRNAFKIAVISVSAILLLIIISPKISKLNTESDGMLVEQIFSGSEGNAQYQQMKQQMMPEYVSALREDRASMVRKDAMRSLIFVLLGAAVVFLLMENKLKPKHAYALLFIIILADMWPVNRRYLNDENFTNTRKFETPFAASTADKEILKDNDIHYRVANLAVSTFNDASTSWFHKSIGGYHGAKMRRYQELYDSVMRQEIMLLQYYANTALQQTQNPQQVNAIVNANANLIALNMLNAKYIIVHPQFPPITNYSACGHAWFVENFSFVNNADEEILKVQEINPAKEAIIDQRFSEDLSNLNIQKDSSAMIELISYSPDKMVYRSQSKTDQLAVFSEVYYPKGWIARIDGEEHNHLRANYVLRSMHIPAGEHEIVFSFEPQTYKTGNLISFASSAIFFILLFGGLYFEHKKRNAIANT
jgi:hypothetical protein